MLLMRAVMGMLCLFAFSLKARLALEDWGKRLRNFDLLGDRLTRWRRERNPPAAPERKETGC